MSDISNNQNNGGRRSQVEDLQREFQRVMEGTSDLPAEEQARVEEAYLDFVEDTARLARQELRQRRGRPGNRQPTGSLVGGSASHGFHGMVIYH